MMLARQFAARLLNLAQHPSHDGAQGLLHDFIVWDQAVWGIVAHPR